MIQQSENANKSEEASGIDSIKSHRVLHRKSGYVRQVVAPLHFIDNVTKTRYVMGQKASCPDRRVYQNHVLSRPEEWGEIPLVPVYKLSFSNLPCSLTPDEKVYTFCIHRF